MAVRLPFLAAGALAAAGCSINVSDSDHRYSAYSRGPVEYGERRVVVEQPAEGREEASRIMEAILDEARARGCRTVSADSWRTLDHREGPDVRGPRVVLTCPRGAGVL